MIHARFAWTLVLWPVILEEMDNVHVCVYLRRGCGLQKRGIKDINRENDYGSSANARLNGRRSSPIEYGLVCFRFDYDLNTIWIRFRILNRPHDVYFPGCSGDTDSISRRNTFRLNSVLRTRAVLIH